MTVLRCMVLLSLFVVQGAATVITFEDLPLAYMYLGGGQNVGSYYSGVTFGPNLTGLDLTGSTAYPPHSGSIAVWDPVDLTVSIAFDTPEETVGIWYTSFDLIELDAYDSSNALLSSVLGAANTDGTTGTSDFLSVTAADIASIALTGSPGNYTFDDLTYSDTAVPEPCSGLLVTTSVVGLLCLKLVQLRQAFSPTISMRIRR